MGFISFNEKYYLHSVERFEGASLSHDDVVDAKRLLKVLDDLEDEGYFALSEYLESKF